jgi:hypothetical protein
MMLAMTCGLILLWRPPVLAIVVFVLLGVTTSVKFVANHSEEEDRKSFRLYEVRSVLNFLLGFII